MSVKPGLYPIIHRASEGLEVDHTDGIGSKGFYHWQKRSFEAAVIDAMAMNLNDLALMQASPYKIQNHIILPEDDHDAILQIVEALSLMCQDYQIAMTGGETSIQNTLSGMDLRVTMTGTIAVEQPNQMRPGDILIGLP